MATEGRGPEVWTRGQLVLLAALNAVGAVALLVAVARARSLDDLGDQLTWINVGVVGLVLALFANGTFVVLGRRVVGQYRRRLLPDALAAVDPADHRTHDGELLLWVPGTNRVHRPTCLFVLGKEAEALTPAEGDRRRLLACEACG
jgi:hypothetical protein